MKKPFGDIDGMRQPYKLLFFCAFLAPALNNLIIGWGMLFATYFSMDYEYLEVVGKALSVLFQALRAAALAATFMTLGFISGKKGIVKSVKPTLFALLCGFGASAVSLFVFSVMTLCGYTDMSGVISFGEKFVSTLMGSLADLAVLGALEAVAIVFFYLVSGLKGNKNMLSSRSPFMITAYIFFGVYTLLTLTGDISALKEYTGEENFFVYCILPFIYKLLYFGVMAGTGYFYRGLLYRYFYEHKGVKDGNG